MRKSILLLCAVIFMVCNLAGCATIHEYTDSWFGDDEQSQAKTKKQKKTKTSHKKSKKSQKKQTTAKAQQPTAVDETLVKTTDEGVVVADNVSETTETEEVVNNETTSEDNDAEETTVVVTEEPEVTKPAPVTVDSVAIEKAVRYLAHQAVIGYTVRQPNLSMVYYVSCPHAIGYSGPSLTTVLKNEIAASDRFHLINSSLEQRIKSQVGQASSAYMYRIAKAQNIDYILSGSVTKGSSAIKVTIKITDLSTGSVVWQRSKNL